MKENVLVTGAAGFVGSHLVELLRKEEYRVRATDLRESSIFRGNDIEFIAADITKKETLIPVLRDIDIVFHCAALYNFSASREDLFKTNVDGVRNLCESILKTDIMRLIHISSGACYGKTDNIGKATERSPLMPSNDYEESKAAGEAIAFNYHDDHDMGLTVVRPALIYGPRNMYGAFTALKLLSQGLFLVSPKQKVRESFVHVEDVVSAMLFLANNKTIGEVYNLADDTPLELHKILDYMSRLLHVRPPLIKTGEQPIRTLVKLSGHISGTFHIKPIYEEEFIDYIFHDHVMDNIKLKRTGYRLIWPEFMKGIKPVMDWYMQNNFIKKGNYKK